MKNRSPIGETSESLRCTVPGNVEDADVLGIFWDKKRRKKILARVVH